MVNAWSEWHGAVTALTCKPRQCPRCLQPSRGSQFQKGSKASGTCVPGVIKQETYVVLPQQNAQDLARPLALRASLGQDLCAATPLLPSLLSLPFVSRLGKHLLLEIPQHGCRSSPGQPCTTCLLRGCYLQSCPAASKQLEKLLLLPSKLALKS